MKKLVALFLSLLMLLTAVSALAEDGVYMRQLPQYTYSSETLLTPESYPEIRLNPNSAYKFFTDYNPAVPVFVCFPGPSGALANEFDTDNVTYLDDANAIQYTYIVHSSASWEEFINQAEEDDYILADGSDGLAAYIDPANRRAYGMLATREFGKSSKLEIRMKLDALSSKMPQDTIITALTDAILPEVTRVKEQMHYETLEPFWNEGVYSGIKMLESRDFSFLMKIPFPTQTLYYSDGTTKSIGMIVTRMNYGTLYGTYNFGEGHYIDTEISIDTNPYAIYKMNENDPDAKEAAFSNGQSCYVYLSQLTERNKSSYCYCSIPLGLKDRYDYDLYLTIKMDGEDIEWGSVEDFLGDVEPFTAYEIMDPADDPYVPAEPEQPVVEPAPEPEAPAAPADGSWTCPNCETVNTGKFCTECGTAKPSGDWTCPNCETVNSGKFCSECGTARPEN